MTIVFYWFFSALFQILRHVLVVPRKTILRVYFRFLFIFYLFPSVNS